MFLNSESSNPLLNSTSFAVPNKKLMLKVIGTIAIIGFVAVTNISHTMDRKNKITMLAS